jgi:hypothetical protein
MAIRNTLSVHECHSGLSFTSGAVVALAVQAATHTSLAGILFGAAIFGALLDWDDKKAANREREANVE